MTSWIWAFSLTVVVELLVIMPWSSSRGLPRTGTLTAVATAQLLTHPALWFLFPRFEPYWLWLTLAETLVCLVEAVVYGIWLRKEGWTYPDAFGAGLGVSLIANLVSTAIGLLGYALRGLL